MAAGAGAIIRLFGPESIGGVGDFGARIDAEAARTGLPPDEIGPKVPIFISYFLDKLTDIVIQRYFTTQNENSFKFLVFLPCMTTSFSHRT